MAQERGFFGGRSCSERTSEAWRNMVSRSMADVCATPSLRSTAPRSSAQRGGCSSATVHRSSATVTRNSGSGSSGHRNHSGPSSSTRVPHTPGSRSRVPNSGGVEAENSCIVAICESNHHRAGEREVGLAAIDVRRPHLVLCQLSDSQSYANTLAKVNVFNPIELLLPYSARHTEAEETLCARLREQYPSLAINTLQRRHFNDAIGLKLVQSFCAPKYSNISVIVMRRFHALAAAAALLKYVEYIRNMLFVPKSLRVEYQASSDVMLIGNDYPWQLSIRKVLTDVETADRLELVRSAQAPLSVSLLSTLSHCNTSGGARLLRSSLLQPMSVERDIESRLDCVQELVGAPALFHAIQGVLPKFADCQHLLGLSMTSAGAAGGAAAQRQAEAQIDYVLLLKTCLEALPALVEALDQATTQQLCDFKKTLSDEVFETLRKLIAETIHGDAHTQRGFSSTHIQRCFAVRTGINALLDVARKTYCELVEDVTDLVNRYKDETGLPLRLGFSGNRGFHVQIPLTGRNSHFRAEALPPLLIQVQKSRCMLTATTQELVHSDLRCKEALREVEAMSNVVVTELLHEVRKHAGCLYGLCEAVTQLDVMSALATVSSMPGYVRPVLGSRLAMRAAHHPVLSFLSAAPTVANHVEASSEKNFIIITGPNMAGKSVYIRQVALLQVLAQVGCFVPAESAMIRVADRIFARIGFEDCIESNASTFALEMREMQVLLSHVTPRSLVLADELCRGTSSEEGTAIAWALCERLLDTQAFTFFATHFLLLTKLDRLYSNVAKGPYSYHMEADLAEDDSDCAIPRYSHRLQPGVLQLRQYGLRQTQLSNMPASVLQAASKLLRELQGTQTAGGAATEASLTAGCEHNESLFSLYAELREAGLEMATADVETRRRRFREIQVKYAHLLPILQRPPAPPPATAAPLATPVRSTAPIVTRATPVPPLNPAPLVPPRTPVHPRHTPRPQHEFKQPASPQPPGNLLHSEGSPFVRLRSTPNNLFSPAATRTPVIQRPTSTRPVIPNPDTREDMITEEIPEPVEMQAQQDMEVDTIQNHLEDREISGEPRLFSTTPPPMCVRPVASLPTSPEFCSPTLPGEQQRTSLAPPTALLEHREPLYSPSLPEQEDPMQTGPQQPGEEGSFPTYSSGPSPIVSSIRRNRFRPPRRHEPM